MKKTICIMALILGLSVTASVAQNDLDSTLVVTEIADEAADSDTTKSTTWTFNTGSNGTIVSVDSVNVDIDDLDDLEDIFEEIFDGDFQGLTKTMEKFGKVFDKFGWLFALIPILIFFILPILLVLIIVFFVYKGRKAKYRAYQQMAEKGQSIPENPTNVMAAMDDEDIKLRNDGVRTICVGIGLAILLGIIMDKLGMGIGALVFFVGVGKYAEYWLRTRDKNKRKQ